MNSKLRRSLAAQGNRLTAKLTIGEDEPDDAVIEHLRTAFRKQELLKVRISTDDREACERVVRSLADRVPCEVVQRVGRVALLYRQSEDAAPAEG